MKKFFSMFVMLCMYTAAHAQGFKLDLEGDLVSPKYRTVNHVVQGLKAVAGVAFLVGSVITLGKKIIPASQGAHPVEHTLGNTILTETQSLGGISLNIGLGIVFSLSSYEYFKKYYEIVKKRHND